MVAPNVMHPAKAECLHHNALNAAPRKAFYYGGHSAGNKLYKRHARLYIHKEVLVSGFLFRHICHYEAAVLKIPHKRAVDGFKCIQRHCARFNRAAAQYHAPAEGYIHPARQLPRGGKRIAQVSRGVASVHAHRVLRTGEHNWNLYSPEHKGQHGRCVRHCIRAVGYHYAVGIMHIIRNRLGYGAPFFGLHV